MTREQYDSLASGTVIELFGVRGAVVGRDNGMPEVKWDNKEEIGVLSDLLYDQAVIVQVYALYSDGQIKTCRLLDGIKGEQMLDIICRSMDAASLPNLHRQDRSITQLVAAQVIGEPNQNSPHAADREAGIKYTWTPGDWDLVRKQHGIPYALNSADVA